MAANKVATRTSAPTRLRVVARHLTNLAPPAAATPTPAARCAARVSTWPLGDPLVYSESVPGEGAPGLSREEAAHFKEHGFIVKRGLLARAALAPDGARRFPVNVT